MRVLEDAQQEVSWSNVDGLQPVGLFRRVPQRALACGAERDFVRGRSRSPQTPPEGPRLRLNASSLDFLPQALERDAGSGEQPASRFVAGADQPEEEMLGVYCLAAEPKGLITGEEQRASGALGVAVEHRSPSVGL